MDTVLVVNAGSSSVKFQVFAMDEKSNLARLIKGQADGIGTRPKLRAEGPDKKILLNQDHPRDRRLAA
jgi:acetate kinase